MPSDSASRPIRNRNSMSSRFASDRSIERDRSPSVSVVRTTSRVSTSPFELLIRLRSNTGASQKIPPSASGPSPSSRKDATGTPARSVSKMSTAWMAEVLAPVSIFAWTGVSQRSGRRAHSRQPMTSSPRLWPASDVERVAKGSEGRFLERFALRRVRVDCPGHILKGRAHFDGEAKGG